MSETTLESRISDAVFDAVLKKIRDGSWMSWNYTNRVPVPIPDLREIYEGIDMGRVLALVTDDLERKIADYILAIMAKEVSTDFKRIMTNTELREDLRAVFREKIREVAAEASDD